MNHRLYEQSRHEADLSVLGALLILVVVAIERALRGATWAALAFGGLAALVALRRLVKGPLLGGTAVEITDEELIFTLRFYIPTKTLRFRLDRIRLLRVVGPSPGRRYRLELDDGAVEEVRPFFGPLLGPRALEFLRMHLPDHVRVVEEKPAGLLAQGRGDF